MKHINHRISRLIDFYAYILKDEAKWVQRVEWNAAGLPKRLYFYRTHDGFITGSGKLIKMR